MLKSPQHAVHSCRSGLPTDLEFLFLHVRLFMMQIHWGVTSTECILFGTKRDEVIGAGCNCPMNSFISCAVSDILAIFHRHIFSLLSLFKKKLNDAYEITLLFVYPSVSVHLSEHPLLVFRLMRWSCCLFISPT
jgi:hypothetical protein